MIHLGDVQEIHGDQIEPVDVITFGSPCFVAGTSITTRQGNCKIENISIGDEVLTHMGRFQKVEKIGHKTSSTIVLKFRSAVVGGDFHEEGMIECTRNHPFYAVTKECHNESKSVKKDTKFEWVHAEDMLHRYATSPYFKSFFEVYEIVDGHDEITVYNMQVSVDHSYVANGLIVKNCQDCSQAGKRAGLKHESMGDDETTRSGLFFEVPRIIKEMRRKEIENGRTDVDIRPRFAVLENVPGLLSSNGGEDFRTVLEELLRIKDDGVSVSRTTDKKGKPIKWKNSGCIIGDDYSLAWRIIDAQYFIPQRRRRITVLVDLNGQAAPDILLTDSVECVGDPNNPDLYTLSMDSGSGSTGKIFAFLKGLSRNFESRYKAWKGTPVRPEGCPYGEDTKFAFFVSEDVEAREREINADLYDDDIDDESFE